MKLIQCVSIIVSLLAFEWEYVIKSDNKGVKYYNYKTSMLWHKKNQRLI